MVDHWNLGDFDDTHRASGFGAAMALATVARWPGGAVEDASDLAERWTSVGGFGRVEIGEG